MKKIVHTEKLDGENTCLSRHGVFARSHAAPTESPWSQDIRQRWQLIKNDLGDLEIFLESLYAIHSIEYLQLPSHYFVFAIRDKDMILSWEETKFYAALLDLPTVPLITELSSYVPANKTTFETGVKFAAGFQSAFTYDPDNFQITMEGIVTRNAGEFPHADLGTNAFKYVRKNHVKTDEHWTRNWHRAPLINEYVIS